MGFTSRASTAQNHMSRSLAPRVAEAREEDFAGEEAKAEGAEDSQDTRKDLPTMS